MRRSVRWFYKLPLDSEKKRVTNTPSEATPSEALEDAATKQQLQFKRNLPSLLFDLGIGVLFFTLSQFTSLSTAALVCGSVGIVGWLVQRVTKIDLMGGLATFGIVMSLITAGYAIFFQDEEMVKMRSTLLGVFSAVLFIGDGLLGGRFLGRRLIRFMPQPDTHPGRLTLGMGAIGVLMAALNYGIAKLFSTKVWLFYTTFVDTAISLGLMYLVIRWATPKSASSR